MARKASSKLDRLVARAEQSGNAALARAFVTFKKLSYKQKRDLVGEVCNTRAAELRLAYQSCGARYVGAGFRHVYTRDSDGIVASSARPTDEPCVVFHVRKRWNKGPRTKKQTETLLPDHLLAFVSIGKNRSLCAVPTDVQQLGPRPKAHARLQSAAVWTKPPRVEERGVLSCQIRVENSETGEDTLFGLCCQHVLWPSLQANDYVDPDIRPGDIGPVSVNLLSDPPATIGNADRRWKGRIRPGPETSMDAALIRIDNDMNPLFDALVPLKAETALTDPFETLPKTATVLRFHNTQQLGLSTPQDIPDCERINYFRPGLPRARHSKLVQWRANDGIGTIPGDSGSPVVSSDGKKILGIILAGDKRGIVYMLPMYYMLDPQQYGRSYAYSLTFQPS